MVWRTCACAARLAPRIIANAKKVRYVFFLNKASTFTYSSYKLHLRGCPAGTFRSNRGYKQYTLSLVFCGGYFRNTSTLTLVTAFLPLVTSLKRLEGKSRRSIQKIGQLQSDTIPF